MTYMASKRRRGRTRLLWRSHWIVSAQDSLLSICHFRWLASLIMFYCPIILAGCLLWWIYEYPVFTLNRNIAFLWIALAPFLIVSALRSLDSSLSQLRLLFRDKRKWGRFYRAEMVRVLSWRYLPLGLLWAFVGSLVVVQTVFVRAPNVVCIWAMLSTLLLFLVSSIGFYGVYVVVTLTKKVLAEDLIFDPYHPDGRGGFSALESLSILAAFHFSSGALVIPLAIEVMRNLGSAYGALAIATYGLIGLFALAIIVIFVFPTLLINSFVRRRREKAILMSRSEISGILTEFKTNDQHDLKQAIELLLRYYIDHTELYRSVSPFNLKNAFLLGLALIPPFGIAIFEAVCRLSPIVK